MQELNWIEHLPDESLEGGVRLLDEFYWHISFWEHQGTWYVQSGDQTLLVTDSRQALDAFLYGMALSLGAVPDHILNQWKKGLDEEML